MSRFLTFCAKNSLALTSAGWDYQGGLRGLIPQGYVDRTRIGGNNTGGCKSAEHPKFARMAEVLCCLLLPCLVPALPASGTQGQAMGSRLSQIARFHRHNLQHPPRPPAVLRSTPDCRTRRTYLHLSYSYASPFGPALLMTQDPLPTLGIIVASD